MAAIVKQIPPAEERREKKHPWLSTTHEKSVALEKLIRGENSSQIVPVSLEAEAPASAAVTGAEEGAAAQEEQ